MTAPSEGKAPEAGEKAFEVKIGVEARCMKCGHQDVLKMSVDELSGPLKELWETSLAAAVKKAVDEAVKEERQRSVKCDVCGGTDMVCGRAHLASLKERERREEVHIKEAVEKAVAEQKEKDAVIVETTVTPQDSWGFRRAAIAAAIRSAK